MPWMNSDSNSTSNSSIIPVSEVYETIDLTGDEPKRVMIGKEHNTNGTESIIHKADNMNGK